MKNTLTALSAALIICLAPFFTLVLGQAEQNYKCAVNEAMRSEGTDAAIEQTMKLYGFDVEAMNPDEPTILEKVKAIF